MNGAIMPIVSGPDSNNDVVSQPIPVVKLGALDELWFQVAGTRCNLTCTHCFISCSPHNDSYGFLSYAEVDRKSVV